MISSSTTIRLAVAFINASLLVGGTILAVLERDGSPNLALVFTVALLLLPTVLFVTKVRTIRRTTITGSVLLITTVLGWLIYIQSRIQSDPLFNFYAFVFYLTALGTSLWAFTSETGSGKDV